jgi:hypothetical protein
MYPSVFLAKFFFFCGKKIRVILIFIGFTSINLTEFSFLGENFARFSISEK